MDTNKVKKILVIRTDRLGDVLLNVPAVRALKHRFPKSRIYIIVQPKLKELIEGNPDIDGVLTYDKNGSQKGWLGTLRLVLQLRKMRFDMSVALNPAKRSNIVTFLAGIPVRVGYDRKWGFLLTHKIDDEKYKGERHEVEYNLELVRRTVGADTQDKSLFIPITKEDEAYVEKILKGYDFSVTDKIIAIHPWSSCQSKVWPLERYIDAAKCLSKNPDLQVAVIGEQPLPGGYAAPKIIDLGGRLSLRQLGAFLKRCACLISNDSGPVHIACAAGTPCVVIFGRALAGVSAKRWGPWGNRNVVLQKDVGCATCDPQDCPYEYKCLLAITVEDVIHSVEKICA